MNKIRFAILGCGNIAERHIQQIISLGELIAVCDIDEAKAKEVAQKYSVSYHIDIDELITSCPQINVVVICTPNGLHANQTIHFLKKGFHVLVEKPIALNSIDAENMLEVAKANKRHLFTVLQNRFNPPVQAVYQAIRSGLLGKLFSVQVNCFWNRSEEYYENHSWHGKYSLDGGVLFTQFSHFIDLLLWYFGAVEKVSTIMHNINHPKTELLADEGAILLSFENGMIGSLHFSNNSYLKNMEGSITLLAEKGSIKIGGPYLNELVYQQAETPILAEKSNPISSLQQVYQSMIRTLQTGEAFYADPVDSLETIKLIERIHASVI